MANYENYEPKNWETGNTIYADDLDHIENGIKSLEIESFDRISKTENAAATVLQKLNGTFLMIPRDINGTIKQRSSSTICNKSLSPVWKWSDTSTKISITIPANTYSVNITNKEEKVTQALWGGGVNDKGNFVISFRAYYYTSMASTMKIKATIAIKGSTETIQAGTLEFPANTTINNITRSLQLDDKDRLKLQKSPEITITFQITSPGHSSNSTNYAFSRIYIYNYYVPFYSFNNNGQLLDEKGELIN